MIRRSILLFLAATFAGSPLAMAQITAGRLDGVAKDAQDLVLPGVSVVLASPNMLGERAATTDVDGSYRFQSLPPGTYTMQFDLPGFASVKREGLVVETGRTFTVNVTLQVATVAETITVTGESPVVDVKSSRFGGQFDETAILDIPNSTDPHALLALTPGIRMQGFDVAGSHKAQQSGFDSFGFRDNQRVVIDGVDSNFGTSGFGFYMDSLTVSEFNISNAGADVENAWAGNTIVMEIKSGGNDWSGLYYIDYLSEGMVGSNLDSGLESRGASANPMLRYWEGHADFGGPIVPDKAWFFLSYNNNNTNRAISGVNPDDIQEIATLRNYYAKVNWQMSEDDQFIGYSQWGLKYRPNRGINSLNSPDVRLAQDSWTWIHKAEWQRVWSSRAFSNFKVMHYGVTWPMVPFVDPATNPARRDLATSRQTGAGWIPFTFDKWRPQVVGIMNYYVPDKAGSHDLKLGLDWFVDSRRLGDNTNSGSIRYRDDSSRGRANDVHEVIFINAPTTTADSRIRHSHFFVQDTWSLNNRTTLNLGLRYANQKGYYLEADLDPERSEFFLSGTSIAGKDLVTWNDFYPRLGLTYDLTGDGKTVVKASYSRYTYNIGAANVDASNPSGRQTVTFEFLDSNANGIYDGTPGSAPPPGELGAIVGQTSGSGLPVGGGSGGAPFELDTKRYVDEITLSFEHELMPDTNLRVSFVRKNDNNVFDTYNVTRLNALAGGQGVPCGDAVFPCPTNNLTGAPLALFRMPDALANVQDTRVTTGPAGFDNNVWDNIEVGLSRRFRSGLFLQGSFHYQWRDELICCGSSGSANTQADPWTLGIQGSGLNHHQTISTNQQHTNWNGKLIGRYVMPYEISTSWQFRAQSGWQYAAQQNVPIPGSGTNRIALSDFDQRSDNVVILDLRFEKSFSFWGRDRLSGFLDFYNVTNANPVLNFNLLTGSSFDRIFAFLEPRTLKIGARYQF